MRGEASRKLFYNNKDLAFDDGYMILIGGVSYFSGPLASFLVKLKDLNAAFLLPPLFFDRLRACKI